MPDLARTHDFQVQLSPSQVLPAVVNPPGFNWPESTASQLYRLELESLSDGKAWMWEKVKSPVQLSFELPPGRYHWRLITASDTGAEQASEWIDFQIAEGLPSYLAPTAEALFEQCDGRDQWLMYFDDDVESIRAHCADTYTRLKQTASLSVAMSDICYPNHYQRGQEEGKREAIANVRLWIDRDLIVQALLFRVWGEEAHGREAMERLLQLAQWSPEGPASLLRPCTWGDEVGCSLARNLFLAYHWLSPLLTDSEKAFVRPMLIRIARQLRERLAQDRFEQYPGHSHTSRLPSYLGLAALTLYREHDRQECEQWLNYSLMIYRSILPFYGGADGSWVEGSFYASTYSKWHHPFFLSVERLSGFSFYEHPFYRHFHHFARDFITPEQDLHPFGDGFWCQREGAEWPGFFSQNPLRIYASRFGDEVDYQQSIALEESISDFRLHVLDAVPTMHQLAFDNADRQPRSHENQLNEQAAQSRFYPHAGLGVSRQQQMSLYYRASVFGNSSHRHGDQGNVAFFDKGIGILIPTGCYGYRFGSRHHKEWTRHTVAHNLPLVAQQGQMLDEHRAIGRVVRRQSESSYQVITLDVSDAYASPLEHFQRTLVLVEAYGLIMLDSIVLGQEESLNWRLHSSLGAKLSAERNAVLLAHSDQGIEAYECCLLSHPDAQATWTQGYSDELSIPTRTIESDANKDVVHLDWQLSAACEHEVFACCIRQGLPLPVIRHAQTDSGDRVFIELELQGQMMSIPV